VTEEPTELSLLLYEFIRLTNTREGQRGPHVSFAMRGGPSSYVHVFGPYAEPSDPRTSVIRIDLEGRVAIADEDVALRLQAEPMGPGAIAGGPTGASRWMVRRPGNEPIAAFVQRIFDALHEHPTWKKQPAAADRPLA